MHLLLPSTGVYLPPKPTFADRLDLDLALISGPRMYSSFLPTFKMLDSNSFPGTICLTKQFGELA